MTVSQIPALNATLNALATELTIMIDSQRSYSRLSPIKRSHILKKHDLKMEREGAAYAELDIGR